MITYHVSPELLIQRKRWDTVFLTIVTTALFALVQAMERKPFDLVAIWVFGMTIAVVDYRFMPAPKAYDLELDDDGLREISRESVKRVILSRKVRYVREWKRRKVLIVSEHAALRAFLTRNRIDVPMDLPQYEQIKSQALQWLTSNMA